MYICLRVCVYTHNVSHIFLGFDLGVLPGHFAGPEEGLPVVCLTESSQGSGTSSLSNHPRKGLCIPAPSVVSHLGSDPTSPSGSHARRPPIPDQSTDRPASDGKFSSTSMFQTFTCLSQSLKYSSSSCVHRLPLSSIYTRVRCDPLRTHVPLELVKSDLLVRIIAPVSPFSKKQIKIRILYLISLSPVSATSVLDDCF